MNNSGITRRIDELGRIVVPKELRNNLGIRDGEPLLIYTNNDSIIIKKYSKLEKYEDKINKYSNIIKEFIDDDLIITDREKVIFSTSNDFELNKKIDNKLIKLIDNRESYLKNELDSFMGIGGYYKIIPIINESDSLGLIILYSKDNKYDYLNYIKILRNLISSC